MHTHPFKILAPYRDRLNIELLSRADSITSDADVARTLGVGSIASLTQVHGSRAVILRGASSRIERADALATDKRRLTLTIRFADCQNFLVFSPEKNILCLIHAGWRGLRSGVIASAFALLKREWSVDPAEVLVAAGPSLCRQCAEFTDPKIEVPELLAYACGRCLDLQSAANDQLFSLGVPKAHIQRFKECTCCHPDRYITYRGGDREEVKRGRTNCLAAMLL